MAATARTIGTTPPRGRWMLWTGRVLSALPVVAMALSATMKLSHAPQFVEMWTGKLGFSESSLTGVGLLELACVALYAIPRTSVLGAVMLTGYLGGAITAHVRIGDPGLTTPLILGVLAWAGLFLRDERVRALMPLRRTSR